jgi:sortase A
MTAMTYGHQRGRRPRWAIIVGGVGEVLITLGLLLLLLVVYELWITGIFTHREQHKLENQLQKAWSAPAVVAPIKAKAPVVPKAPPFGAGVAILHSEVLGAHWKWVVVEGVGTNDLAKGPGHYPGTALPGQVGNFVVSGHRTTHGAPFFNTDKLQPGDAVVVETATTWFVYKITSEESVSPSDVGVVLPVPNEPKAVATQKLLTFTTCNPKYSASHRLIVHGVLATQELKTQGQPAALTTGKA